MNRAIYFILFVIIAITAGWSAPELQDSIGIVGVKLSEVLKKFQMEMFVGGLISFAGAAVYRLIQIALQKLPTRWKWINNKLTLGIVNKFLSWLFGKTTMVYNAKISEIKPNPSLKSAYKDYEKANDALKKEAIKHLSRNGGIMKAFNEAIEEMK